MGKVDECLLLLKGEMERKKISYDEADLERAAKTMYSAKKKGLSLYKEREGLLARASEFADKNAEEAIEFALDKNMHKQQFVDFIEQGQAHLYPRSILSNAGLSIKGSRASIGNMKGAVSGRLQADLYDMVLKKHGKSLKKVDFSESSIRAMWDLENGVDTSGKYSADVIDAAKGLKKFNERLVRVGNENGMPIKARRNHLFSQSHDAGEILKYQEDWVPMLMEDGMLDWKTSLVGVAEKDRPKVLGELKMAIIAGEFREGSGSITIGNREIDFASAESLIRYNKKFGKEKGDIIKAMDTAYRGLSKKIAYRKVLGRRPMETYDWIIEELSKEAKKSGPEAFVKFEKNGREMRNLFKKELFGFGEGSASWGVSKKYVQTVDFARQIHASANLVYTAATTLTDLAIGPANLVSKFGYSIPHAFKKYFGAYLDGVSPAQKKKCSRLLWLHSEDASFERYMDGGPEGTAKNVLGTLSKYSGLEWMTTQHRHTEARAFAMGLADISHQSFDQLDLQYQKTLEAYRIDASDWDIIRKYGLEDMGEGIRIVAPDVIKPEELGKLGIDKAKANDAALKLGMLFNHEGNEMGAPMTDAITGAQMHQGVNPRSALGATMKGGLMYKSFGVHILKVIREVSTHNGGNSIVSGLMADGNNAKAFGTMMVGGFVMSAMGLMARDIAMGKEPGDPFAKENIWRAVAKGLIPIAGDPFIQSWSGDSARSGGFQSAISTAVGPVANSVNELFHMMSMAADEGTSAKSVEKRIANFMKYTLPVGNPGVAYVWRNMISDGIINWIDGGHQAKLDKKERERKKISDRLE